MRSLWRITRRNVNDKSERTSLFIFRPLHRFTKFGPGACGGGKSVLNSFLSCSIFGKNGSFLAEY